MYRIIPFTHRCETIATAWYAAAGHHSAEVAERRARAPRHATKPSSPSPPDIGQFTPPRSIAEMHAIRLAWEAATV